jgi:hypothetical protein
MACQPKARLIPGGPAVAAERFADLRPVDRELIGLRSGAKIFACVAVPGALLGLCSIVGTSVGAALVFRPGHRQTGFDMICIGLLPIFIVLVGNVI